MIFNDLDDFSRIISHNLPLIGIDYGEKKIGISISDLRQRVASSREVYVRRKFSELSQSIGLIEEIKPVETIINETITEFNEICDSMASIKF